MTFARGNPSFKGGGQRLSGRRVSTEIGAARRREQRVEGDVLLAYEPVRLDSTAGDELDHAARRAGRRPRDGPPRAAGDGAGQPPLHVLAAEHLTAHASLYGRVQV